MLSRIWRKRLTKALEPAFMQKIKGEDGGGRKAGRCSAIAALIFFVVLSVCACIRRIDPAAYTQAVLDVTYKNKTEQYMELTGASAEQAEKIFQDNLTATSKIFKGAKLSETLENNYNTLFKDIIMQVNYTVGETVKDEKGNYTVELEVKPMTLFDDTYEEFQMKSEEYARNVTNGVMNGEEMPSEEEMRHQVYQIYYDILRAGLDAGVQYGTPEEMKIHVNRTEKGTYEIPAEDIRMLDEQLISQDKLKTE